MLQYIHCVCAGPPSSRVFTTPCEGDAVLLLLLSESFCARLSMGKSKEHWVLMSRARLFWRGYGKGVPEGSMSELGSPFCTAEMVFGGKEPVYDVLSNEDRDSIDEDLWVLLDRAINIFLGAKEPLHFLVGLCRVLSNVLFLS